MSNMLSLIKWLNTLDKKELKSLLQNLKFGMEMEIILTSMKDNVNRIIFNKYKVQDTEMVDFVEAEVVMKFLAGEIDEEELRNAIRGVFYNWLLENTRAKDKVRDEYVEECLCNKGLTPEAEEEHLKKIQKEMEKNWPEDKALTESDVYNRYYETTLKKELEECQREFNALSKEELYDFMDMYYARDLQEAKDNYLTDAEIKELKRIRDVFHRTIESLFSPVKYKGGKYHSSHSEKYPKGVYLFRFETDLTLDDNAFEFILPPLSYKEIITKVPKLVKKLDSDAGISTKIQYGWHIHVSEENTEKYENASKTFYEIYKNPKSQKLPPITIALLFGSLLTKVSYIDNFRELSKYSKAFDILIDKDLVGLFAPYPGAFPVWEDILDTVVKICSKEKYDPDKIDIGLDLNVSYEAMLGKKDYLFDFGMPNFYQGIVSLYYGYHDIEIILKPEHSGIENRAPGGRGIVKVVSNANQFKHLLLDSLWRYYVVMNFDKIMNTVTINQVPSLIENFSINDTNKLASPELHKIPNIGIVFIKEVRITDDPDTVVIEITDGESGIILEEVEIKI